MRRHARWVGLLLLVSALASLAMAGCGSAGGGQPALISRSDEISIGRDAAAKLEAQYGVDTNAERNQRLQRIGERLAAAADPDRGFPWRFRVLNQSEVNALALPGGFVYATRGLMEAPSVTDAQLAGVIGHEVAHVTRHHAARQLEKAMGAELLVSIATRGSSTSLQQASDLALQLALLKTDREAEYDSDRYGTIYADKAGYDPAGLLNFLRMLAQQGSSEPRWSAFLRTHPLTQDRIDRLQRQVASMQA